MKPAKRTSKWFYYIPVLLLLALGISGVLGWLWWNQESAPPVAASESTAASNEPVLVQIAPGTASQQIGRQLEAAGLIRSYRAWRLWSSWLSRRDGEGNFKSGSYRLSPTQPLPAIAEQIWKGQVVQLDFTIPEGWSLRQMATYFEEQGFFKAEDFLAATRQIPKDKFPWLPDNLPHLEGFLYPDTYKLASDGITPQVVIDQMLKQFEQVALPLYNEAQNRTKFNLLEWVTLASIVEKEAVVTQESGRIAGVFVSRLEKGMTLGSDPTVEYALGIRQTADQPLTYAQVKVSSPYNTYVNPGLPPGPIASPGAGALRAVLYPENTEYLYFVARYDGTHVFSRSLAEHESAIRTIRRQRQAQ